MTLLENLPAGWNTQILATDLDTNVLQTASDGIYTQDRITDLSPDVLKRWFMRSKSSPDYVKVKPELQEIIQFKQLNLMQDWGMQTPFDVIFCRNVLIYFDRETKTTLAKRYAKMLASKSWLFIGHSESLNQICNEFELVATTSYRKNT
jgi:chemotaxis protein methyltransferase CheR